MIGAMTEHTVPGTGPQVVCPFVAFDDDRDFRAGVPDHRHRCFAESPAASRALAHQAAYCLSPAFSGCPTFIDWARREAAPPKEEPIRTLREAPSAPREIERFAGAAGRPTVPQQAPQTPPRRGRRTEWTAPPPWAASTGAAPAPDRPAPEHEESAGRDVPSSREATPEPDEQAASPGLGAWSGSALASLAASRRPAGDVPAPPVEEPRHPQADTDFVSPEPAAPAFLAGRASRPGPSERTPSRPADPDAPRGVSRPDPSRRAAVGYAPGEPAQRRVPAPGRGRDRSIERGADGVIADPAAPSWERPRRFEAYPSLKSGGGVAAMPRPVLYALIVLMVGLALFATPFLLRGLTGGGGPAASPTPIASASSGASAAPSITPVPSPSPTVYTVKAGDTLSRIATKYGTTVDALVKANPQIKNPDKLALGDQLVIPPTVAPAITDGALTPAPSPSL